AAGAGGGARPPLSRAARPRARGRAALGPSRARGPRRAPAPPGRGRAAGTPRDVRARREPRAPRGARGALHAGDARRPRGGAPEAQPLLAGALAGLLPPATLRAVHAGPLPPPRAWSGWLDEALTPARIAAHGFFRREMVVRLLKEHRSGARDHTSRLWSI